MNTVATRDRPPSPLRAWRLEQGLSQEAAAASLGFHQASWSGWETGEKTPTFEVAARLEVLTGGRTRVEHFGYDAGAAIDLAKTPWRAAPAQRGAA